MVDSRGVVSLGVVDGQWGAKVWRVVGVGVMGLWEW